MLSVSLCVFVRRHSAYLTMAFGAGAVNALGMANGYAVLPTAVIVLSRI
jgi:membrane carboxypeptidase/penicillin-binding protein